MKNHNKQDKLYKNRIIPPDEVENISSHPVGDAFDEPRCIYNHQRHATGSVINNVDGSVNICKDDGWTYSKPEKNN